MKGIGILFCFFVTFLTFGRYALFIIPIGIIVFTLILLYGGPKWKWWLLGEKDDR